MKKVYGVSHGTYSGYTINGIFSTCKKAQKYMDDYKGSNLYASGFNDIEEWVIDEKAKAKTYITYHCGLKVDNGELLEEGYTNTRFGIPKNQTWVLKSVPVYGGHDIVRSESYKSHKHALKLAVEERQRYLREKVT